MVCKINHVRTHLTSLPFLSFLTFLAFFFYWYILFFFYPIVFFLLCSTLWSWYSVICIAANLRSASRFSMDQNQVVKPEMLKIEWWTRTFSPYNLGNFFRSKEIYIDRSLPCGKEDYFWAPCKEFWLKNVDFYVYS